MNNNNENEDVYEDREEEENEDREEEENEENEEEENEENEEEEDEENEEERERDIEHINQFLSMNLEDVGVHHANRLWKELFYGWSKQHLIVSIVNFFRETQEPEALFYYIIANPSMIDELRMILNEFTLTLKSDKIVTHIIDGWDDFFIRTNYAVTFFQESQERRIGMRDEFEIMETYRQKIRECITFLIPYLGEGHCINSFYQRRLFEMFFIRL